MVVSSRKRADFLREGTGPRIGIATAATDSSVGALTTRTAGAQRMVVSSRKRADFLREGTGPRIGIATAATDSSVGALTTRTVTPRIASKRRRFQDVATGCQGFHFQV
nr:hypothetical protein [Tanacetum cinerariifolium]